MRKVDLYFSDLSQFSFGARTQFFPKIINPVSDKISNANQLWSIKAWPGIIFCGKAANTAVSKCLITRTLLQSNGGSEWPKLFYFDCR